MTNTAKRISRIAAIGLIAGSTLLPVATVWADEKVGS